MSGGVSGIVSSPWADPLHAGRTLAASGGGQYDPLQLFPVNQPGGANYIAAHQQGGPSSLPPPAGNINPQFYNPNSFMQRQPSAPGIYNQMAAQLAGPQYNPQLMHPGMPMGGAPGGGTKGSGGVLPGQSGGALGAPGGGMKGGQGSPQMMDMLQAFRAHTHGGPGGY